MCGRDKWSRCNLRGVIGRWVGGSESGKLLWLMGIEGWLGEVAVREFHFFFLALFESFFVPGGRILIQEIVLEFGEVFFL